MFQRFESESNISIPNESRFLPYFKINFFLTDLNSSMNNDDNNAPQVRRQDPRPLRRVHIYQVDNLEALIPSVRYYKDPLGYLNPINGRQAQLIRQLAFLDEFIIGVVINGGIYPMFNWMQNQVLVTTSTGENVVMTIVLHAQYDRYFALHLDRATTPHQNQRRRLNQDHQD